MTLEQFNRLEAGYLRLKEMKKSILVESDGEAIVAVLEEFNSATLGGEITEFHKKEVIDIISKMSNGFVVLSPSAAGRVIRKCLEMTTLDIINAINP